MVEFGWKMRLSILLSALWLGIIYFTSGYETNRGEYFFLFGIVPISLLWGFAWVLSGYKKTRKKRPVTPNLPPIPISTPTPPVSPSFQSRWKKLLSILSVLCFAAALGILIYSANKVGVDAVAKIGYLAGYSIWIAIIIYLVWRFVLKKRERFGLFLFSLCFLALSAYESQSMIREMEESRYFLEAFQKMIVQTWSGERITKVEIEKFGRLSPLMSVSYDFFIKIQNSYLSFQKEVEESNLDNALTPKNLKSPNSIFSTRERLIYLSGKIDETEKLLFYEYGRFPNTVDATPVAPHFKSEFKKGFERGVVKQKKAITAFFQIEREIMKESILLLTFLQKRQGLYTVRGEEILFVNRRDVDEYNSHLNRIRDLALQESEWQNAQYKTAFEKIGEMDKLIKK